MNSVRVGNEYWLKASGMVGETSIKYSKIIKTLSLYG
jgi:hypothetical protein